MCQLRKAPISPKAQQAQARRNQLSDARPFDVQLDVSFLPATGDADEDVERFDGDDDLALIDSRVLPLAQAGEPTAALLPLEARETRQDQQREDYRHCEGHFHAWRLLHYAESQHSNRNKPIAATTISRCRAAICTGDMVIGVKISLFNEIIGWMIKNAHRGA